MQLDPTQFQKQGEQQHSYDAGRELNSREKNNQFTQSQTAKSNGTLTYHILYLLNLKTVQSYEISRRVVTVFREEIILTIQLYEKKQ